MNLTDIMLFGEAIIGGGGSGGGTSGGVIVYDGNKEYDIPNPEFPIPKLSDVVLTESQMENAYIILDALAIGDGKMLQALKPVILKNGLTALVLNEPDDDGFADGFIVISEENSQMFGVPSGTYYMPQLLTYTNVKVWLCWE